MDFITLWFCCIYHSTVCLVHKQIPVAHMFVFTQVNTSEYGFFRTRAGACQGLFLHLNKEQLCFKHFVYLTGEGSGHGPHSPSVSESLCSRSHGQTD